jgi:hypothetical protein
VVPVAVTEGVGAVVEGVPVWLLPYQFIVLPLVVVAVNALAERFWQSDRLETPGAVGLALIVTLIDARALSQLSAD